MIWKKYLVAFSPWTCHLAFSAKHHGSYVPGLIVAWGPGSRLLSTPTDHLTHCAPIPYGTSLPFQKQSTTFGRLLSNTSSFHWKVLLNVLWRLQMASGEQGILHMVLSLGTFSPSRVNGRTVTASWCSSLTSEESTSALCWRQNTPSCWIG